LFAICNSSIAVSSLPSEPAEASPGPHPKGDDEIRKMAEAIMDKVVNQLLNEAAEIVLKED
jgi:DNA topoisomerase VI subunit B